MHSHRDSKLPGTSRRYKLQDTSGCASKREVVVDLTGPTTPGGTRYFFDSDWLAIEPSKHSPCKIRKRQHEHQNACTRSLAGAELCAGNGSRALGVPFPSGWLSLILLDGVVSLRLIIAVHIEFFVLISMIQVVTMLGAVPRCRTVSAARVNHGIRRQTRCPSDAKS